MPTLTEFGRWRRRDAKYHDERCARRARYLNALIAKAAKPGGAPLPDWARDAFIARHGLSPDRAV